MTNPMKFNFKGNKTLWWPNMARDGKISAFFLFTAAWCQVLGCLGIGRMDLHAGGTAVCTDLQVCPVIAPSGFGQKTRS